MVDSKIWMGAIALAAAVCGIYLLQAAWRKRGNNGPRLIGGWGLLLSSILAWSTTSGADKGAAIGITVAILVVLVLLSATLLRAPQRTVRTGTAREYVTKPLGALTISRRVLVGILMGPVGFLSAVALCTASFMALKSLNAEHTANLTIVSFAFPLVWGGLLVTGGADTKLWRKSLIIIGSGAAAFAYILFSQ